MFIKNYWKLKTMIGIFSVVNRTQVVLNILYNQQVFFQWELNLFYITVTYLNRKQS